MQFSFFNFDKYEKCYIELCKSCLDTAVIHKWEHGSEYKNIDSIIMRVILENTFNIGMCDFNGFRKTNSFSAVIDFDSVDRPVFFYIGIKSLPFKKKVVKEMMNVKIEEYDKLDAVGFAKLCCYVIACPYEMMDKFKDVIKVRDVMCNKYNITLYVLNYLVQRYVLHAKPRKIIAHSMSRMVSLRNFDVLRQTMINEIVHKICMKGVEFCKNAFNEYRLHYCGRLLFNVMTIDNAMYGFNVQNLNSGLKLSTKIGLENFKIVLDKHNRTLNIQDKCWKHEWNFEFVLCTRFFNRMIRSTAIMPIGRYLMLEHNDETVGIPAMKARLRSVIDVEAVDKAIVSYRYIAARELPNDCYKYVSMLVSFDSGTVESIMYASILRKICKLQSLSPMMCTYLDNLYVFYELPCTAYLVDQNKLYQYESSNEMMMNVLLSYAFIYVLGWHCVQFTPYRCGEVTYTDGLYLRVEDCKQPIILKQNRVYVKQLLEEKYMSKLVYHFNNWVNALVKNKDIPPTIEVLILSRIMRLYELSTWIT